MNIKIASDIAPDELKNQPFLVACVIEPDANDVPALRTVYPFELTRRKGGGFALRRTDVLRRDAR